jgi:uncharacterized membrane protein YeaQ/YmgE (transglycosylase-associated protein family)
MSVVAWIVLGLIAGFIASKVVNKTGEGLILDIVLGIVGAIVGGFLATRLFDQSDVHRTEPLQHCRGHHWRHYCATDLSLGVSAPHLVILAS